MLFSHCWDYQAGRLYAGNMFVGKAVGGCTSKPDLWLSSLIPEYQLTLIIYFGYLIAFKVAFNSAQYLSTVAISTFSSGLCGNLIVGPTEIISQSGY